MYNLNHYRYVYRRSIRFIQEGKVRGFIYRTGIRIKEAGERIGLPALIKIGIFIKNMV